MVNSRGTFKSSPSNTILSDRRWKSPNKDMPGTYESPSKKSRGQASIDSKGVQSSGGKDQLNMLTIDRVEAMKVLTNKHSKVAKVPIEIKNHFCSHVDPGISA